MAYVSETTDGLTKWWVVGTGSSLNRLSEVMDDQSDGPYLNTGDVGAWTQTPATNEWYMTLTTQPDGTAAGQDVYDTANTAWLTANHGNEGSLGAGEWAWNAGTITVRLGDDSDPNASDPYAYYDWSNFMTETVEDGVYLIHQNLEIGDGSTATTLTSLNESVWFDTDIVVEVQTAATLTLGELAGSYSQHGSFWSIEPPTGTYCYLCDGGTVNIYASIIQHRTYAGHLSRSILPNTGYFNLKNSIFDSFFTETNSGYAIFRFSSNMSTINIDNLYAGDIGLRSDKTFDTFNGVWVNNVNYGLQTHGDVSITEFKATNIVTADLYIANTTSERSLISINPVNPTGVVKISYATSYIKEQYTINVHVTDSDGANLSSVYVNLEGSDSSAYDTDMWTADSVQTAADGTITEQTITARKWVGTSETETDYNVFRMTLRLAGYETLVLENITIDSPVDWHLELQPIKHPPAPWEHNV